MGKLRPFIGITMGDPAGIGPEIAVKALQKQEIYESCRPVVIGDARVMEDASSHITKSRLAVHKVPKQRINEQAHFTHGTIDVLDLHNVTFDELKHGTVSAMSGKASYEYIETAIKLALEKTLDATVTGPIHKEALNKAGYAYSGHTEIYAALTGTKDYAMMLASDNFRVIHVSTHVSLKTAIERVKTERILAVIRLADTTLARLGVRRVRIAVAGLNPHGSDGGLFGDEEEKEIAPAVQSARDLGIDVDGPLPPDTCFSKTKGGQYDIAVAMYHDQGHIPIKMVGFVWDENKKQWSSVSGINVTLGLPIIRTSVDHGVAFGKAGKGCASEESLVAAIETAILLAQNPV